MRLGVEPLALPNTAALKSKKMAPSRPGRAPKASANGTATMAAVKPPKTSYLTIRIFIGETRCDNC